MKHGSSEERLHRSGWDSGTQHRQGLLMKASRDNPKAYHHQKMPTDLTKTGVIGEEEFIKDMEGSFKHKFASKPQVIEGNMRALKRSLEEVQVG